MYIYIYIYIYVCMMYIRARACSSTKSLNLAVYTARPTLPPRSASQTPPIVGADNNDRTHERSCRFTKPVIS